MASALLFHGKGARDAAAREAQARGRILLEVEGSALKVDQAREAVSVLGATPVGDELGVVLLGPMDRVSFQVSDVLLKVVEEFDGEVVLPVLWAYDLGDVPGTLQSRCETIWSPDDSTPEATKRGEELLDSLEAKDIPSVIDLVVEAEDRLTLLGELVASLFESDYSDEVKAAVWVRLRPASRYRNVTEAEMIASLCRTMRSF
jgi:hypothetical protein